MPKDTGLEELLIVNTLSRMDGKLDKLDDRMDGMASTLVKQQTSLDEHIKRSNLLEAKIDMETKAIKEGLPESIQKEMRLARNKALMLALKIAGALAGLGGGGWGVKQIIGALAKAFSGQ